MNLFFLSRSARLAAIYHCDRHVRKMAIELCQMLWTAHWMNRYLAEGMTEEETMKMVFKRVRGATASASSLSASAESSEAIRETAGTEAAPAASAVPSESMEASALGELLAYDTPMAGGPDSLPPESDMTSKLLTAAQLAATPHPRGSPTHFSAAGYDVETSAGGTAGRESSSSAAAGMGEDLPGWLWSYERARSTLLCAEQAFVEAEGGLGGIHSGWGQAALELATDAASFSERGTRLLDKGATWEQLRDAALLPALSSIQPVDPELYASPTASPLPTPTAVGTPAATPQAKGGKQRKGSRLATSQKGASSLGLAVGSESVPAVGEDEAPLAGEQLQQVEEDDAGGELPPGPATPHASAAVQAIAAGKTDAAYRPVHAKHPTARWVRTCAANYAYTAELAVALCAEYKIRFKKEIEATAHALWLREHAPPFPDRWSALAVPPAGPGTAPAEPAGSEPTSEPAPGEEEQGEHLKPARKRGKKSSELPSETAQSTASPRGRKRKPAGAASASVPATEGGTKDTGTRQTDFFPRFAPDAEAQAAGCFKLLTYAGAGKGRKTSSDTLLKVGEETYYACRSVPPGCTPVPLAMFPPFWAADAIQAYRDFYNGAKIAFADYSVRAAPAWLRTQRSGEASFLASLHAVPTTVSQALARIDRVTLAAARNAERIRAGSVASGVAEPSSASGAPAPSASSSSSVPSSASGSDTGYGSDTEGATGQGTSEGAGRQTASSSADSELAKGWVGGGVGTLALNSKRRGKKLPDAVAPIRDYRIKFLANRSAAHGIPATTIVDSRGNVRMALQLRALQLAAEDVSQRATAAAAQVAAESASTSGVTTSIQSTITADFSGPGITAGAVQGAAGASEVDLSFTVHVHSSSAASGHAPGPGGLASAAMAATSTLRAAAAAIEHDSALGGDGHVSFSALPDTVLGEGSSGPALLQVDDQPPAASASKRKRGKAGKAPQPSEGHEGGSTTEKLASALQAFPLSATQPDPSAAVGAGRKQAASTSSSEGGKVEAAVPAPKPRVWLSLGISETAERKRLLSMRDEEMALWVASVQDAAKQAAGSGSAEGDEEPGEQDQEASGLDGTLNSRRTKPQSKRARSATSEDDGEDDDD